MLTVKQLEHLKPRTKPYKKSDGGGLLILVNPIGSKFWRFKYRFNGRGNWISLGGFPEVTLTEARDARDAARKLLREGKDPSQDRKAKKLARQIESANDFKTVTEEFLGTRRYTEEYSSTLTSRFENYVFPKIGSLPIAQITPPMVLAVTKPLEKLDKLDTAHRVLAQCGQVFRYGVQTGRCPADPTRDLRGALAPCDPGNYAAITKPEQVGPMLRMIDAYEATPVVRAALQLAPLVFTRPGELRKMRWEDVDMDAAEWRFPISKRKRGQQRRELIVPLCRQALEILVALKGITGSSKYVFRSLRNRTEPISDNTLNGALRTMGIPKDLMTSHGFRAMARTILAEVLKVPSEIIELQLGHVVRDPNGTAYNRTAFLPDRRDMMQRWADYLDGLRAGRFQ